jgi:exopolysaccharide production protein ExoQ
MFSAFEPIPLHPHNAVLQIWLELGLVGAAVAAAMLCLVAAKVIAVGGPGREAQGHLLRGAFFTAVAVMSVSFGIWQSWWLCTLCLTLGFAAALRR